MTVLRFEAPLVWPEGLASTPRANQKSDHGFPDTLGISAAIGYLDEAVQDRRIDSAALSLDMEQPLVERLRKKVGNRTGACLHLKIQGRSYALGCDKWLAVEHNIYALHLALRQIFNMERWGVGSLAALLNGFETNVMPSHIPAGFAWMDAMGLGATATLDDAIAVYHRRAKTAAHDPDALTKLNLWMEEARSFFSASRNGNV